VEMPVLPQLGAELELGTLLLAKGKPPTDPTIAEEGGAHAIYGAVGLQARPFVTADPTEVRSLTGIWASSHVGATTTGGLFRAVVDLHVGYDFLLEQGRYGVGPALSWVHVFQPDTEFRPDDANVFVLGVHAMFDSAPRVPPDRDHDGIIDRLDACPDAPEDKDGFEDTDGCPDLDNDKDGILDQVDHCPNDPEDKDGFEDTDGCPDPDNDKDGLVDREDLCPNEPETKNGYADEDGCPDEEQVRVIGEKIVLDDRINFEQNNAIIRPVSFPLLERLAKLVREHPEYTHIEVQGHTDQKGTKEFNEKLSLDRAKSVLEFMASHGVVRGRLSAVGFGSAHLLVDKTNERALYLNRRVEFLITREVNKGGSVEPGAASPAPPGAGAGAGATPAGEHNETVVPPSTPADQSSTPADKKEEQ
jgi:outer membrane protein OmpA-like peptidoglycan-associated protein